MRWFRVWAHETRERVVLIEAGSEEEAVDIAYGLLDGGGVGFGGTYSNTDFDATVLSEADNWDINDSQYEKFEYSF